jgi:hypothetical protein
MIQAHHPWGPESIGIGCRFSSADSRVSVCLGGTSSRQVRDAIPGPVLPPELLMLLISFSEKR